MPAEHQSKIINKVGKPKKKKNNPSGVDNELERAARKLLKSTGWCNFLVFRIHSFLLFSHYALLANYSLRLVLLMELSCVNTWNQDWTKMILNNNFTPLTKIYSKFKTLKELVSFI